MVGYQCNAVAGMGISWAMDQKVFKGDSVTGWAKKGLKGSFGG